jgi:hypothetical protein
MSCRGLFVLFVSMSLGWTHTRLIEKELFPEDNNQRHEFRIETDTEEDIPLEENKGEAEIILHYI